MTLNFRISVDSKDQTKGPSLDSYNTLSIYIYGRYFISFRGVGGGFKIQGEKILCMQAGLHQLLVDLVPLLPAECYAVVYSSRSSYILYSIL